MYLRVNGRCALAEIGVRSKRTTVTISRQIDELPAGECDVVTTAENGYVNRIWLPPTPEVQWSRDHNLDVIRGLSRATVNDPTAFS